MKRIKKFFHKTKYAFCTLALTLACVFAIAGTSKTYAYTYDAASGNLYSDNLCNYDDGTFVRGGYTITITNGVLSITGTDTEYRYLYFNYFDLDKGTYTINGYQEDSAVNFYMALSGYPQDTTFNVSETVHTQCAIEIRPSTLSNYIVKPMLNKGTTALPFEPYGVKWYSPASYESNYQNGYSNGYSTGVNNVDNSPFTASWLNNLKITYPYYSGTQICYIVKDSQYGVFNENGTSFTPTFTEEQTFSKYGLFVQTEKNFYQWASEEFYVPVEVDSDYITFEYTWLVPVTFNDVSLYLGDVINVSLMFYLNDTLVLTMNKNQFDVIGNVTCDKVIFKFSAVDVTKDLCFGTLPQTFTNSRFYTQGYEKGTSEGFEKGVKEGTDIGYEQGVKSAQSESYQRGYAAGEEYGYQQGSMSTSGGAYSAGYAAGRAEVPADTTLNFRSLIWSIASTPFESFKSIWNVDLLGVNIGAFFTAIVTLGLGLFILKKIL